MITVPAASAQVVDPANRFSLQRQLFIDGRESLANGNANAAAERIAGLNDYPLQSYYEYLVLRLRIKQSQSPASLLSAVESFNKR
ncbi:MAG: hypothetical protein AAF404_09725 [Pseudomonadota bacterium]